MSLTFTDALERARQNHPITFSHGRIEYNHEENGWYIEQHNDRLFIEDKPHFHEENKLPETPCWIRAEGTYYYATRLTLTNNDWVYIDFTMLNGEQRHGGTLHPGEVTEADVVTNARTLSFLNSGRKPNDWRDGDIGMVGDQVGVITVHHPYNPSREKTIKIEAHNTMAHSPKSGNNKMVCPVERRTDI